MCWQPGKTLESIEKEVILKALRFYQGNKTHTSRSLGIAIRTIDNKLEHYGIKNESLKEAVEKPAPTVRKREKVLEKKD